MSGILDSLPFILAEQQRRSAVTNFLERTHPNCGDPNCERHGKKVASWMLIERPIDLSLVLIAECHGQRAEFVRYPREQGRPFPHVVFLPAVEEIALADAWL